jgi:beta-galactosidase
MAHYPPIMKNMPVILHGGDYNPEQWLKQKDTIWKNDMALAREAGFNTLSVGIFSWSHLEPEEDQYDFSWLDEVINMLYQNGMKAVLATPSGARPAWLAQKYPEVLRVNNVRQKALYGGRHNHCLTSPVYRAKVAKINEKLALRYGKHPALGLWHVSNEYSGECHCPLCQEAFRKWLKARYGNIEALNEAWWNSFWAHRYQSFDQIESPTTPDRLGENENHGIKLAWKRFTSDQHCDFYSKEIEPLKRITPEIPCTHNMMSSYPGIDYFALGNLMDRISWDNYPHWTGTAADADVCADTAFRHDLMRGTGNNKPFLMMESSPSVVNWDSINTLRRPGTIMLQSLQSLAHGSDTVQYFQLRKGRGSFEKFHGAVVDHVGTNNTRIFQEVCQVGETLKKLSPIVGSAAENRIALIYDWENRWALEDARFATENKGYIETVIHHHTALMKAGYGVDVNDQTKSLAGYKMVVSPMCYLLRDGFADKVKAFVSGGGTFVMTYVSGYVNQEDLCFLGGFPGHLREVAGIWAEDIDVLPAERQNSFTFNGRSYICQEYFELSHAETAEVLATYQQDFYKGSPALTVNSYGSGSCYYIAARTKSGFLADFYRHVADKAGLSPLLAEVPDGITVTKRVGEDGRNFLFLMNSLPTQNLVHLDDSRVDLLTGKHHEGNVILPPRGVMVLENSR